MRGAWRAPLRLLALAVAALLTVDSALSLRLAEPLKERPHGAQAAAAASHHQQHAKHLRSMLQQANQPALTHFGGVKMEGKHIWMCDDELKHISQTSSEQTTSKVDVQRQADTAEHLK
jgi:hypothetical protein